MIRKEIELFGRYSLLFEMDSSKYFWAVFAIVVFNDEDGITDITLAIWRVSISLRIHPKD